MISAVKGTHDVLDVTLHNWLLERLKRHLTLYHFHEIVTPVIEPLDLFQRTLGTETDVVSKEMYLVTTRHATPDSESICLRPELTAAMMRAFVNAAIQTTPWKVFSYGPAFRHERPQKGRYRQFHQMSMEIVGSESVAQDALFIAMLDAFFANTLQLSGYALVINYLGTRDDRASHRKALVSFLEKHAHALCALCQKRMATNVLRVFDCKQEACQAIYQNAPTLIEYLSADSQHEWDLLKNMLQELSVSFTVKPTLVRGLDYYNKTVFEFVMVQADTQGLGAQSTFCAGGRYDSLATELGASRDYPAIGAAIGFERLLMILEQNRAQLPIPEKPALTMVIPLDVTLQPLALHIVQDLHAQGVCADVLLEGASLKSMLKTAHKMGAKYAVLLGDEEQATGQASVKNMITGHETKVPQRDIAQVVR